MFEFEKTKFEKKELEKQEDRKDYVIREIRGRKGRGRLSPSCARLLKLLKARDNQKAGFEGSKTSKPEGGKWSEEDVMVFESLRSTYL